MIGQPAKYQRTGIAFVAVLVLLVVVLGWRAASLIGPTPTAAPIATETESGKRFLVYRTYHVVDRGAKEWANDDAVVYEFLRFPIDGAAVPEQLLRVQSGREGSYAGSPWMSQISDATLLFARRAAADADPREAAWMDVSGKIIDVPDTDTDLLWNGLPSSDGGTIVYADRDKDAVSVLTRTDGLTRSFSTAGILDMGYLAPHAWAPDGRTVYLKTVFEGEAFVPGLWTLDTVSGEIAEVGVVRELGLSNFTIAPSVGMLAGSTFDCESLDRCGVGPSTLYLVDLATGEYEEVLSHEVLAFTRPLISPDGSRIAYTFTSEGADIRLVDPRDPSTDRRLVSGHAHAWTPDGRRLVVDRSSELQLFDVATGAITSVARRSGNYQDPDFRAVDFIGIVEKR